MVIHKRLLYVLQATPYGNSTAQEGLDALFAASIFEQLVSVLFIGDGTYQLLDQQAPRFNSNIQKQLKSLPLYDIEEIYVCERSLMERKMDHLELAVPATRLSGSDIQSLMRANNHILSF